MEVKKKEPQVTFKQKIKEKKSIESKREIKNIFNFSLGQKINFFEVHK